MVLFCDHTSTRLFTTTNKDLCALPWNLISLIFMIDVKEFKSNKWIESFLDKLLSWILPAHQNGGRWRQVQTLLKRKPTKIGWIECSQKRIKPLFSPGVVYAHILARVRLLENFLSEKIIAYWYFLWKRGSADSIIRSSTTIRLYVKSQDPVQKSDKLQLSSFVSSPCLFELRKLSM